MFAPDQFITDFEALSKLLSPPAAEDKEEQPERGPPGRPVGGTPAAIGPSELLPVKAAPAGAKQQQHAAAEEAPDEADAAFDQDDGREVPSHEVVYKQAVGASDAFLGMSGKDPSSACCEDLVVRIRLPAAASAAEMDLDVRPTRLRLLSARYKLLLHLPRKVDAGRGCARWDAAKRELSVSAPIVQEEPF
ncbi:MAG: hypothetical protein J3K34DRAFT_513950 [Monoraphidium minutum]|nr:MAG: hypothetical protein J3K34DRAFT_513950 [Monoraphidium minutum]